MTLWTVLVWSIAASIFAGCSGGAGSGLTSGALTNRDATNSTVSLQLDVSRFQQASTRGRSPQFIGASVNNVAYSFTPGPIAGTIALSTCAQSGTPTVYTCTIGLPANTYNATITLEHGATAVGTGSATGIAISPSTTTPVSININPINAGPAIAIATTPTQFYVDGHAQSFTATVNELDPAGNIITTFYGPVSNYPTLTFNGTGGTAGVTLNGGNTISAAPSAQAGNAAATVAYNGTSANANSLGVTVSDGTTPSNTITIPYVTLTPSTASLQFATTGAGGALTLTMTEAASTGGVATLDTQVKSTTTCSSTDVTIVPAVAFSPTTTTSALTAGAITYTLTANDVTFAQCSFTTTSVLDPNLTTTVAVKPSGGAGVIVH